MPVWNLLDDQIPEVLLSGDASLTFLGLLDRPARWDIPTAEIPPIIHISHPSLRAGPLLLQEPLLAVYQSCYRTCRCFIWNAFDAGGTDCAVLLCRSEMIEGVIQASISPHVCNNKAPSRNPPVMQKIEMNSVQF